MKNPLQIFGALPELKFLLKVFLGFMMLQIASTAFTQSTLNTREVSEESLNVKAGFITCHTAKEIKGEKAAVLIDRNMKAKKLAFKCQGQGNLMIVPEGNFRLLNFNLLSSEVAIVEVYDDIASNEKPLQRYVIDHGQKNYFTNIVIRNNYCVKILITEAKNNWMKVR